MDGLPWKEKKIGIAGCGGLGGYLAEFFLRLGVKHIVICDGDKLERSNMDRQILCNLENLGHIKVEEAKKRASLIAPETEFEIHPVFLTEENGEALFQGCDLVLDALDNMEGREALRIVCAKLRIPLIHGGIGDWGIQVGVLYPGDRFPESEVLAKRQEQVLSFVPATCAGLQAAEAVKILQGEECTLKSRIRYIDLRELESFSLSLDQENQ